MNNNEVEAKLLQAEQAIAELEMKVAFQDHTIDALNDSITEQQYQLDKVNFQLKHLIDKVKSIQPSDIAKASEETPPPHY